MCPPIDPSMGPPIIPPVDLPIDPPPMGEFLILVLEFPKTSSGNNGLPVADARFELDPGLKKNYKNIPSILTLGFTCQRLGLEPAGY